MASIKVVLKNKVNAEGRYPLAIQIIKDRKSALIFLGQYVNKHHWDTKGHRVRKSCTGSTRLNNYLRKKVSEVNDRLIELELEGKTITAASLKAEFVKGRIKLSFLKMAQQYLDQVEKQKKFNQLAADRPKLKYFKEFLKEGDISFKEINVSLLKKYQVFLQVNKQLGKRTITNHLTFIRTVFNLAIGDTPALAKYYPFNHGGIKIRIPDKKKVGLTLDEVQRLENLELEHGTPVWHTRNVWLFSFYFAGMRIADVVGIKWEDLRDGRLHYAMNKNDKVGSLKIPAKAMAIIGQYKDDNSRYDNFVFPELKAANLSDRKDVYKKVKAAKQKFNEHLKTLARLANIDKPLTNHIARHTFGNISGDKVHPLMLQKLYRHSSLATTLNYQGNFIHKDADDALEIIIGM